MIKKEYTKIINKTNSVTLYQLFCVQQCSVREEEGGIRREGGERKGMGEKGERKGRERGEKGEMRGRRYERKGR